MLTEIQVRATSRDYEALPEGAPYQLIDGELILTPAPDFHHQEIIFEFSFQLASYLRRNKIGRAVMSPVDVILDDHNAYQPDVIFIRSERSYIIKRGRVFGAPDFVMEVLSPGTAEYDLNEKKATYELAGVREYWIVDPMEQAIEIFLNRSSGDAGQSFELIFSGSKTGEAFSEVLPGFQVSLKELFGA